MRVFLASVVALLAAAGEAHSAPLRVVTSNQTFASLAQSVGGDRVMAEPLSRGYQDPHFVEPKPSLVVTLSQADLLVYAGLDLEVGWLPPLVANSRNERIQPGAPGNLDASAAIDVLDVPTGSVSRAQGDIHPRGNPHYWIPPVNGLKIAKEIAARLTTIDPSGAAAYDANLRAFANQLKSKAPVWSEKAAKIKGLKVVTYHRSWSYVVRWLGLDEVGEVEIKPGIPPDPQHLAELIRTMRAQGARALLVESFYNRSIAGSVAEKADAKLLVMPSDVGAFPQIHTYPDLVDAVLDELSTALPK